MSEFWKYFHDVLCWPQIHEPGPLQGLTRGAAHALDSARDDIVYFRRQFFPAFCEDALVPLHGASRGIVRHPKESAAQYRARVVNAYRWHLLGGKTLGLPQILEFYGFNALSADSLRRYQPSRWAEFQIGLATPVTQEEQDALLADLDTLIWLVNEYKPARSVLARLYTSTYNWQPTVWSEGPAWSEGFWSHFSGVPYGDEGDRLIVSFGMVRRTQAEAAYGDQRAGLGIESATGALAPYIDRPVWSQSEWSDVFPRNHGFTLGELISLHWCVRTTTTSGWAGGWDGRHWREFSVWDRPLPKWRFRHRAWAKVEAVWSWPGDGGEPGDPVSIHGNGTWGDVNACWGRPSATVIDTPPRWGDPWGKDAGRRELTILERFRAASGVTVPAVTLGTPQAAGRAVMALGVMPRRVRGWSGAWRGKLWLADVCPAGMVSAAVVRNAAYEAAAAPRVAGASDFTGQAADPAREAPRLGMDSAAEAQSAPLRNQGWSGTPTSRRWWNYTGQTAIRSEE